MEPIIEVKKLSKIYKIEDQNFVALSDINLNINRGEFVIILGQSGCGKSTLLNMLGGMDVASAGHVLVSGQDIAYKKPDRLAKYRREEVGMIFQKFHLINDASVLENVKLPLKFSGLSEKEQNKIAKSALASVDLSAKAKSLPKKLSGGQQQRVAIARALVNDPEILLCDEPTGNLDSKTGEEILSLIEKLNLEGRTVVMVTHNVEYARFADRVVKMLDGKIISDTQVKKQVKEHKEFKLKSSKTINLKSTIALALKNLRRRKLRFFLTSFGIAIGAMAIIILVSFGAGLQKEVLKQLQTFSQAEEIMVSGESMTDFSFSGRDAFSKTTAKKMNDATVAILEKIPNVEAVFPSMDIPGEMVYGDKISNLYMNGSTPLQYITQSQKDQIKYGELFKSDTDNAVIIPSGQATALGFASASDAIGKDVTINSFDGSVKAQVKISGVIGEDEKFAMSTLVPQKTFTDWFKKTKASELQKAEPDLYQSITVRATDTSKVSEVKKAIDDLGFGTTSYEDIANQMNKTFIIMQVALGVIGGIALLVASLGIINTMIMSVLERTKEIGVMKAVGARNKDINSIFLSEAMSIGLVGGLIGLLLGIAGSKIAQAVANNLIAGKSGGDASLTFFIPTYLSVGVVAFCIVIAAAAGFLPARRASKLDPAEALREE